MCIKYIYIYMYMRFVAVLGLDWGPLIYGNYHVGIGKGSIFLGT